MSDILELEVGLIVTFYISLGPLSWTYRDHSRIYI